MKTGSLRLRLFLAGAVSIIIALSLSAFGLTALFGRHVERRIEAELQVHLAQVVAGIDLADGALAVVRAPADPRFDRPLSGLYWQVEANSLLSRSRSLWDQKLRLPVDELADGSIHVHRIAGPDGGQTIAVERSIGLPQRLGGLTVRAVVARDAGDVAAARKEFAIDLAPYLALLGVFLIGAAYAQIAIGLKPMSSLRDRLAAVRSGGASRFGQSFPDEILPLASELDGLLEAREAQIARARARASDLAHGLKTPLQVLAGDIERLKAKGEHEIAGEIEQVAGAMRRHVDRQLARARMAAGNPDVVSTVSEVVSSVVAVVARTPDGVRLRWQTHVDEDMTVRMDPDDLAEALGNLVENAARHASGEVSITARAVRDEIAIAVQDDGPGISGEEMQTVLSRGGQLDTMGSGAGLGLAIVGDIADAWGGRLDLDSGAGGLVATLSIPVGGARTTD